MWGAAAVLRFLMGNGLKDTLERLMCVMLCMPKCGICNLVLDFRHGVEREHIFILFVESNSKIFIDMITYNYKFGRVILTLL
jgi:hypothetical protein